MWVGCINGASRVWSRRALPGVASLSQYVKVNLQETAEAQAHAEAAGQPWLRRGLTGSLEELQAGVEQALTFSSEAAALELFPIWSSSRGH